ncbi:MAG: DUF1853 family protein [Fuerstiella sp.]
MDPQQGYQDLIWAAQSHSLLRDDLATDLLSHAQQERLKCGDFVNAFDRFLARRTGLMNHKVGLYFELLVEFLIAHVLQGKLVHRGQQVIENGRTIGEVDFVFEHHGETWHLETAVKFYLFVPEACSAAECLVGPNSSDSFESKMDRLFHHQLPLSQEAFPEVTNRVAFVKGRIFYPHQFTQFNAVSSCLSELPDRLNPEHETGVWCRAADCHDFFRQLKANRYVIRRKPHWLADSLRSFDSADVLTRLEMIDSLSQHFQSSKRPLMLSSFVAADGLFEEVDRIFVVDDTWPWQ